MPQIIVGAGPIGLAAAAHLLERGLDPIVLEAGDRPAAGVATWEHVTLFSPWSQLIDPAARRLLEAEGQTPWVAPDPKHFPTGGEWVSQYLIPLAERLGERVILGARVIAVGRRGHDLMDDAGRADAVYQIVVQGRDCRQVFFGDAVIDASGTLSTPNPLGADGLRVAGEAEAGDRIDHAIPDTGADEIRRHLAGRQIAVVGSGHSAMTAVLGLAKLKRTDPSTTITWLRRRPLSAEQFGGGSTDQLVQRGALGQAAHNLVKDGQVGVTAGFRIEAVHAAGEQVVLEAQDGRKAGPFDRVFSLTGYRPDLSMLGEVRLDLDPAVQAPRALGPLIDPNVHSCGTVPPHGVTQLSHPDDRFFIAGMKSYGRAPTFLAMTGFEQVRSIAAYLAGDSAAATRVELELPETGVCGGTGLADIVQGEQSGCC